MPEGDTVWLSARRMHAALAGRPLDRSEFRVPRHALADLRGRAVIEVVSRGKHMLTRLEGDQTIHTHFGMEGSWRIYRPGQRWTGGPGHHIRLVLSNADNVAVGYRLVAVDLLPRAAERDVVGHLGPDLLGPDWNPAEAVRRLAEEPDRQIGVALLDQRNLAGIGNLYKCELLFLRGVHPWTKVGDVADLAAVVALAHRLLDANKNRWEQVTTGDTRPARQHYVYGRLRQPCRRCATPIARAMQGEGTDAERVTYWCPNCQPTTGAGRPPPADWRAQRLR